PDRMGAARPARRRARPPGHRRGRPLPRGHPGGRRVVGGAVLHRHRLPQRLPHQVPPLPHRVPRHGARTDRRVTHEGRRTAERIARGHDENFPVAFLAAHRDVRADMRTIYAYCRLTDDIGDEGTRTTAERLDALDTWQRALERAVAGGTHDAPPVLVAVADTIRRRRLPLDPFLRLIEANREDQRRNRWETHDQLLDYCRHSATPVGEMVLGVLGYR